MKPQPTPEKGQHWRDKKHNVVRRIIDATNPWYVEMVGIVSGRETKVFRVSEWGRPARYEFVPKSPVMEAKEEAAQGDVHIRFSPGEGPRRTYCMKPLDAQPGHSEPELITTTLSNLDFWRKRRTICSECDMRREDGKAVLGELSGAA